MEKMEKTKKESRGVLANGSRGLSAFLWKFDYDVIELMNGVTFLGLGLVMIFSPRDAFAISAGLSHLPFVASISALGVLNILLGIWKLWALKSGTIRHRKWLTFSMSFVWAFYTLLFAEGAYRTLIIFFTGELCLFSMWAYIRLVIKHRSQRLLDPRDKYNGN